MKYEKSPSAYVYDHRLRLKCRATSPFVFAVRYDHIEAYKHTCEVVVTSRKFFRATQSQPSQSLKHNFVGYSTKPSCIENDSEGV